ncbi:general stress protein [Cellulomonas marina]|uniref:General stress protein 17M-like domain-containing protein n=1 Tax=Cellulomonas marina TaxID=988821 RepID=A0A1I1A1X0_9CELL|nr:general stress protein [Cellulomonas marina]GIG30489.1 hypothetical protein Cma02nite_30890 [Cellulomonas marina]SFB31897.1 hypothetical protein SAMN05421867_11455 [Cellulomonas marina]
MSLSGNTRSPRTPTLPQGETVASYATYLEAQKAVDHLSDKEFPVELVTIVGTDLRMVERVMGRLTYPRVALSGFASGAWFGISFGLLIGLLAGDGLGVTVLAGLLIGGAFGLLFAVVAYAFTGGRRDFTSSSQIVATTYSVLCREEKAHQARQLLAEVGGVQSGWGRPQSAPVAPPAPRPQAVHQPVQQPVHQPAHQPAQPQPGQPQAGQPWGAPQPQPQPQPQQPPQPPQG